MKVSVSVCEGVCEGAGVCVVMWVWKLNNLKKSIF